MLFNFHPHYFAGNGIEDCSSYLLFEAYGDSEADSLVDIGGSTATLNSTEFNDAESCTDDTPALCDEFVRDEDGGEEEEEEVFENDGMVESKAIGFTTRSSASIDSTKEFKMLNEVDKNRLFWETCLAS